MARRIFLSYSHDDRAWRDAIRQMLAPALERFGVELWADDHVRSGHRWELVIGDALADAELGLVLVTPAYLTSSFSWEVEVPALVASGAPIVWMLVQDCLWEHNAQLREFQGLQDPGSDGALADHPRPTQELARLCRKLCDEHLDRPGAALRRPAANIPLPVAVAVPISAGGTGAVFGPVPERPSTFVARADEFDDLRAQLVEGLAGAVGVVGTASVFGLHGRGGIGKTVLASELARDSATLSYFPDGVFWVSLGERPDVVGAQRQLAAWLGGDPGAIRSPMQGTKVLRELAGDRQCLVVLDDVWSVGVAQAFAVTGTTGRLLLTTRDDHIVSRVGAATIRLDVLSRTAGRELLAKLTSASALPPEAEAVLEATGRVALAVALVGAAVGRGNQDWATVARRLTDAAKVFAGHPYADTFKALEVATASLGDDELGRYQALACFPGDTVIPTRTIGRLWGLDEPGLGAQLGRLDDLKLGRLGSGGLLVHDQERDYLLLYAEATALAHEQLLEAHQEALGSDWYRLDPDDPYMWEHLTYHLAGGGRHLELIATVSDPAWLAKRVARDGTLAAERDLVEGLRWEPDEARLLGLLQRVRQTSHLLDRASTPGSVAATLATHLWPLRERVDLKRLDLMGSGLQPIVSWVADATSPQLLRTLLGHEDEVRSVAWALDGSRLASAAADGTVRVWDAVGGAELLVLRGHAGGVSSVAWSPDGLRLASGAGDSTVRVWDAANGLELLVLRGHAGGVRSVAWSPDGLRLASGAGDSTVRVWDAACGVELRVLLGHSYGVWSVAWSPDGARLASGASDVTVRVWDVASGTALHVLPGVLPVAWSPDGSRLASAASDVTVRVWDAADGTELYALRGPTSGVFSIAWARDGARLASAAVDGTVRVWDAASSTEPGAAAGDTSQIQSVAWSPDGARLASGAVGGTVRLWDAAGGAGLVTLSIDAFAVMSVAWSPDGLSLALAAVGDGVWVWDAAAGTELRSPWGDAGSVWSLEWSPDGTRLATGDNAKRVRVWDAAGGSELRTLLGHTGSVRSVAWSPDGTRLASGADTDGMARVWDPASGIQLHVLSGHSYGVWSVAWSPDGTRLASGAGDGRVRVWDAGGTVMLVLSGHSGGVSSVAWSPDGTRVASGGHDGTVRFWDPVTGREICCIVAGEDVSAVGYSRQGPALAVATDRAVIVLEPQV